MTAPSQVRVSTILVAALGAMAAVAAAVAVAVVGRNDARPPTTPQAVSRADPAAAHPVAPSEPPPPPPSGPVTGAPDSAVVWDESLTVPVAADPQHRRPHVPVFCTETAPGPDGASVLRCSRALGDCVAESQSAAALGLEPSRCVMRSRLWCYQFETGQVRCSQTRDQCARNRERFRAPACVERYTM